MTELFLTVPVFFEANRMLIRNTYIEQNETSHN
jgi:hypothetical protein